MKHQATNASRKTIPAMLADTDFLFRLAKQGADSFLHAQPFPHLVLSTLVKTPCCAALTEGMALPDIAPVLRLWLWELSSSTLIRHFTTLTAKPPLLPDPFFVHSGRQSFATSETLHASAQEYVARHPHTQLLNVLRLEVFVAAMPKESFELELLDSNHQVVKTCTMPSGSALLANSDDYRLRYRMVDPLRWRSLVAYYYINDRARNLNGEEQPRASY